MRPFAPQPSERTARIVRCVLALGADEVESLLQTVLARFENRHRRFRSFLLSRYASVREYIPESGERLTANQKLLIGSYFTMEYSFECAALFNPSIVWHPDQSGLDSDQRRFILSLRAVGEGHLSSLAFRTGIIDGDNSITMVPATNYVEVGDLVQDADYERELFRRKLHEIGSFTTVMDEIMNGLPEYFEMNDLNNRIEEVSRNYMSDDEREHIFKPAKQLLTALAKSNYEVTFQPDQPLSGRILFPTAPTELNGIEDARFVRFTEDDGSIHYYATYTAYNGVNIVPQLIETDDFLTFKMSTLNGPEVHNKGIALFPRKVGGKYAMLSRQGNENIYLMRSEHSHFWYKKQEIVAPIEPWEFVQLGNCGSPIETENGWLVLTHGVGPMRTYSISALLLDLGDPSKVIGRMREPMLVAENDERDGYVPNVVYSCGAVIHGENLILPYAVSDHSSTIAIAKMSDIMASMKQ